MPVRIERCYDFARRRKEKNEYAVLVDRVWPRGMSKQKLGHDEWLKDLAPSTELRQWFGHDPEKWTQFQSRYKKELKGKHETLRYLRSLQKSAQLTLLYSASDTRHNQATVLARILNRGPLP